VHPSGLAAPCGPGLFDIGWVFEAGAVMATSLRPWRWR
jgi:hypothetical protein